MKSAQVCLLSLGCVGGAFAFGLVANAAIDLVMPAAEKAPVVAKAAVAMPAETAQPAYTLASTTATPVDLGPVKVKTIPMLYGAGRAEPASASAAAAAAAAGSARPAP